MALASSTRTAVLERLEQWFTVHQRDFPWRHDALQPWQVLVVEIMLQQTQAERVARFIESFFSRYPTTAVLAAAKRSDLEEQLAPLGLQRQRAAKLLELSAAIEAPDGQIPRDLEGLKALPGVGPYVAAAYLCVVHQDRVATVDVNLARIIERLFGPRHKVDIRYDPHINGLAAELVEAATDPREFNWAALDLGAMVCRPRKPRCPECPLLQVCPGSGHHLSEAASASN